MRVLCPAVLALEAVALLLAVPVVLALGTGRPAVGWALAGLAVVALVTAALFRRRPREAVVAGWVVQGLAVLAAVVLPVMAFVGLLFGALWWAATHYGAKADRARAAAG